MKKCGLARIETTSNTRSNSHHAIVAPDAIVHRARVAQATTVSPCLAHDTQQWPPRNQHQHHPTPHPALPNPLSPHPLAQHALLSPRASLLPPHPPPASTQLRAPTSRPASPRASNKPTRPPMRLPSSPRPATSLPAPPPANHVSTVLETRPHLAMSGRERTARRRGV